MVAGASRVPPLLIHSAPSQPTPLPPARPPHWPRELPTCTQSWHQSPVQAVAPTCLPKAPLQRPLRGQAGRNGHPHPPAGGLDPSRLVCGPSPAGRQPTPPPPPPDQEPSAQPAGSPAGSGPSPGSAAAVTAAPLLRSCRWGGSSEPCRAPPTTQPPPRAGARPQGRNKSINLPRRFLHPPPQPCLSPTPHSQGVDQGSPHSHCPNARSLCWVQRRVSVRELTGRLNDDHTQMGPSLPSKPDPSGETPPPHPLPRGPPLSWGGRPVGSPEEMLARSKDRGTRQAQGGFRTGRGREAPGSGSGASRPRARSGASHPHTCSSNVPATEPERPPTQGIGQH